jgi:hypothetical protein
MKHQKWWKGTIQHPRHRHSRILIAHSVSRVVRLAGVPRNSPSAAEIDARYSHSRKGLHALLMIHGARPNKRLERPGEQPGAALCGVGSRRPLNRRWI